MPFDRSDLLAGPLEAARRLIGARLVRGSGPSARVGRIVELEAYAGLEDAASHARMGRTGRNAPMFGPPGRAYVFLVYGMYNCLNVVTECEGSASAVLIRAVQPLAGIEAMRAAHIAAAEARLRKRPAGSSGASISAARRRIERLPAERLACGPGLVGRAFSIERSDNGLDLCDPGSELRLEAADGESLQISAGPRVGVGYASEPWRSIPWRLFVTGNPCLSRSPRRVGR